MLTEEQLQQTQLYVEGKNIPWYDVQLEIADHLGELVEAAMAGEGLSFEAALWREGARFSADWPMIVQYKARYARRKVWRAYGQEVLSYFLSPKIGITLLMVAALFWMKSLGYFRINRIPFNGIMLINAVNTLYLRRSYREVTRKNQFDPNMWRRLLSGRQLRIAEMWMGSVLIGYLILMLADCIWWTPKYGVEAPPTLLNSILFYSMPLLVIATLSWRKTGVELNRMMRSHYPAILREDRSLKEILADWREQHPRRK